MLNLVKLHSRGRSCCYSCEKSPRSFEGSRSYILHREFHQPIFKVYGQNVLQVAGSFHGATGSQFPVYVPNGAAQQLCISQAYAKAGRTPLEADYVELHMTGQFGLRVMRITEGFQV